MKPGKHYCARCKKVTEWKEVWVKGKPWSKKKCKCAECGRVV